MTKEQIKFLIDNKETIFDEIEERLERLENLGQEIDLIDDTTIENIKDSYDKYYKHCSDILDKYNLNFDAFKIILSISNTDKLFREQILGRAEANQLLRDVIDIYGDEAYEILGCNSYDFKMSDIDGILLGENNEKYEKFYIKLLNQKCEQAHTLEQLSKILLSTKPEYINQELIKKSLKNIDQEIFDYNIREFIDAVPSTIIDGNIVKELVDRVDEIYDTSILAEIPHELFDTDFSKSLLEKSDYNFIDVFNIIPEQVKDIDMWEYAVSKESKLIYSLPEQKIDENMTDEEYTNWCNKLVVDLIRKNPDNIQDIFDNLRDFQKTIEVCTEGVKLLQSEDYDVIDFLEKIPETSRSRQIYEILLQKSENIINEIPNETFEEGLSQEEYKIWLDDILVQKISEIEYIDSLHYYIPRENRTEKVWNALLDRCKETNTDNYNFSLSSVPIQNISIEMCERALTEINFTEIKHIPSIDRKTDLISSDVLRKEYEEWIGGFSEKEKQKYREWYEGKVIDYIREDKINLFTDDFENSVRDKIIPPEAITINIINTYLQEIGPTGIEDIPTPNEFTNYNEQYKDIIDKVIVEAIKKHPKYLDYADIESENFEELLQLGYKNKLNSIGRTELSEKEIDFMKQFAKNNSSLFSTLDLDILTPEIISIIGENSIEKIVRYKDVQSRIVELSKDEDAIIVFALALENLKQDSLFVEPLIEQLSKTIEKEEILSYNSELNVDEKKPSEFLKLSSSRIKNDSIPLTEEEKTIISYLALNPKEANQIKDYDEILNFVANKNVELDAIINSQDVTLVDVKNAYFERIVGMSYDNVLDLIKKYSNDPEQLLVKYKDKELETYKEKSEKESLEIILKLKSLFEENNLDKIRQAYQEAVGKEDKIKSFERFKQSTILDNTLRRAYGRDFTRSISNYDKENNTTSIERTEDGQEYVVRKLNGPFNRMISVMNAYGKSNAEIDGDMHDRWNTSTMAENHALCYSFINESNPGIAMLEDEKGIIISISDFNAEAVTAVAPYDLFSDSRINTIVTARQQRFYTTDNLPNQTRNMYSEINIEIQDVSEGITEYKKIQPTSIICFEEIDEDSINAAIELSKKLGKAIPIELIDRRELANQTKSEIEDLLEQFKNGESLQPELVEQIITKFNNIRNAHMESSLADELLGEKKEKENLEAPFNKAHLNEILSECIEVTKQRIEKGQVQDGLQTIEQIKQYIKIEREKNVLIPTMYEKQIISGIDLNIDYSLDEIQRTYGKQEILSDAKNESLQLLEANRELSSPTFHIIYGKDSSLPEQLSFSEFRDVINISEIQRTAQEVQQKAYYNRNQLYSEEHIVRVAMLSNAIANLEGQDDKTKQLLGEAVKYYSSGRVLDSEEEQHQEYSAKIAGKELGERYSQGDKGIIQAAIELQKTGYESFMSYKTKKDKVTELCSKYGLNVNDVKKVDTIAKYIEDSVILDKTRFAIEANNLNGGEFDFASLKTDAAKRLVKSSYCIQDQLSTENLKEMVKVAHIDYEVEKDTIMKKVFKRTFFIMGERRVFDESIIDSPIVQEKYFMYKYGEIEDPVQIGRKLGQSQENTQTKPIRKTPAYTEQQIGKATIHTPITSKNKAQDRVERDERKLQQSIEFLKS